MTRSRYGSRGADRRPWWWRRRRLPPHRLFWTAGAVSGLAAIVTMECGWVVTEVGRQPWVVYRLQTTAAAATTNGGVITSLNSNAALFSRLTGRALALVIIAGLCGLAVLGLLQPWLP